MKNALKMETKLCRICGRTGLNFLHIFQTEGLRNKIETCLPIVVTPHCLLPETICGECLECVENFYNFIKNCLQNIIVLETQLDIHESCLKTKRKKDKSCWAALPVENNTQSIQTEDYLDILLGENKLPIHDFPLTSTFLTQSLRNSKSSKILVDYDLSNSSTDSEDEQSTGRVISGDKITALSQLNDLVGVILGKKYKQTYLDDAGNTLIHEISERKNLKRKSNTIENSLTKICRYDSGNRRKCKQPQKVEKPSDELPENKVTIKEEEDDGDDRGVGMESIMLPQHCLLCSIQLEGPAALAAHFVECHAKQYAGPQANTLLDPVKSSPEPNVEKKKKSIPNLVKISDLRKSDSADDGPPQEEHPSHSIPSFECPNCPAVFTVKNDLMLHLTLKHVDLSAFLCGLCLAQNNSLSNLKSHLQTCSINHPLTHRYYCQVCLYSDDNERLLENHVLVHKFLLDNCRKDVKNFNPEDYVERNSGYTNAGSPIRSFVCLDCGRSNFGSFTEFSGHRRMNHSIYHCDLCNKFYGRNSHLWKHVNRLHRGHPSVTCQICFKTSASKYHLAQHFSKIHQAKPTKKEIVPKLEPYDLNAIKESFVDQEDDNSLNQLSDQENDGYMDVKVAPKEIDSSHNLYTNIITNYTPPANEGDFKCPKCSKAFHKKMLLKKHKKNCRPKLQKDLLTRCKSCARIFKDRQSLTKHLVNYHSEYICEICNEKMQSKCEIVSHIRFQHPSSHLVCAVCQNILRCRKDLLDHLADHGNSYVCQFCADSLPSKVKLKMHILSLHRKILSLSCGICLKLFENQHVLRDHVTLVHKDRLDPLTSCPVCGKNYGSKWKTYDHLNKSHGRIFRACKVCLEIFDTDAQLEAHGKVSHVNQPPVTYSIKPNPAALLSAGINNNRNSYFTDSEGSNEASDNSETEDEDQEDNEPEPKDHAKNLTERFPGFGSQDNKISLLEKRLMGKKITSDDISNGKSNGSAQNNPSDPQKTAAAEGKNGKDHCPLKKETQGPEQGHNGSSSKRTVYVNSNDPSCCDICHKTWPAKKHLWQHYIRCHKSVAATVCGICLKTNADYESLQTHLKDTHPTLLYGQGFGSNFICRICGRYHNASSKLKLHMVIHENFDWGLLERIAPAESRSAAARPQRNGHKTDDEPAEENGDSCNGNDDMFDDLIEQIEESSNSSGLDEKKGDSSSEECGDDAGSKTFPVLSAKHPLSGERCGESCASDESSSTVTDGNGKSDEYSSEEDDDDRSQNSRTSDGGSTIDSGGSAFGRVPEELDSAVKSISYDGPPRKRAADTEEFAELQSGCAHNENEIESAVGSIL
ncbi:zinc finger protein 423-like [Cylas formicarius]|uniref:zinc finger protein 423-like n=1 Tax=Cylas formicarius TaxID=197179 RepID=UPI0029584CD1|nr:zinc finger protein 423-like [Cylas formicarius]